MKRNNLRALVRAGYKSETSLLDERCCCPSGKIK